jgi:hypothetical protein
MLPVEKFPELLVEENQFSELKKVLETWRRYVAFFDKEPANGEPLYANPELPHFLDSLLKLFVLFKWPPWEKFNRNPGLKDEFEKRLAVRASYVRYFFNEDGVDMALRLIKTVKQEDLVCCSFASLFVDLTLRKRN